MTSEQTRKEAIRCQIDLMEKEIIYLKGRRRTRTKRAYLRLLQNCGSTCKLDEPIYLQRYLPQKTKNFLTGYKIPSDRENDEVMQGL